MKLLLSYSILASIKVWVNDFCYALDNKIAVVEQTTMNISNDNGWKN